MKLKPYLDKVSGEYITEGLTPQDGADSISDFDSKFIHTARESKIYQQYIQTKIDQEVKKRDNTPIGASKWKELGVKYGYYEYFRKEEVKKVLEEIKNDISKNSDKKLNFGWSMNDCEYGCMNEILNLIDNYLK